MVVDEEDNKYGDEIRVEDGDEHERENENELEDMEVAKDPWG